MKIIYILSIVLVLLLTAVFIVRAVRSYYKFKASGSKDDRRRVVTSLLAVFILTVICCLIFVTYNILDMINITF